VIAVISRRQLADVFYHLRRAHGYGVAELGRRVYASSDTIHNREVGITGIHTDALIDTAAVFGFDVALMPKRHPGARSTGTGWPEVTR
jgi:hypothetical protein